MPTIHVDDQAIEVQGGTNLLQALLQASEDLPYFCWHPALGSVGACRQCAVTQYRDEDDTRGRIVMACMTEVTDGARFGLAAESAAEFRTSVIENLMLNHPHDCPVCEEGGECHLQDMTVMVGHRDRDYQGRKTTYRNQYLGPLISHEMNRCITCYRCTRFYQDYAGGVDLAAMASRDRVYFGRESDGILESEFAGNLVEVCPTGVFTDKPLAAHYSRKWDLASAPTVCTGCSLGCNTHTSERYGELRRIHNRYNYDINGYFLCDRGRFGGGYVNGDRRIPNIGRRNDDGTFSSVSIDAALEILKGLQVGDASRRVVGVGSPRTSLEANFALRALVGEANFCNGIDAADRATNAVTRAALASNLTVPTMRGVEQADAILIVGEDLTNHAPRLALSVRQAAHARATELAAAIGIPAWQDAAVRTLAQEQRHPVMILGAHSDRLDDIASVKMRQTPASILETLAALSEGLAQRPRDDELAGILDALLNAKRPLVITGNSLGDAAIASAALAFATKLRARVDETGFLCVPSEGNSLGVSSVEGGLTLEAVSEISKIDALIVVENDLSRRLPPAVWQSLRGATECLIVIDAVDSATATGANLVFPAAAVPESEGTWINFEGRAQRSYATFVPAEPIQQSWAWLLAIARGIGNEALADIDGIYDLTAACAQALPELAGITGVAPDSDFRSKGARVARMPARSTGRTAMSANISVHEPKQPSDADSPLAFSMEGHNRDLPAAIRPFTWSPGWNSNQSIHKFQAEIGGASRDGDAGTRLFDGMSPDDVGAGAATDERQLIPRQHIFGSDELTGLTEAIGQLSPSPYLAISKAHAAQLGVVAGDGLQYEVDGEVHKTAVAVDDSLPDDLITYPAGIGGTGHLRGVLALTVTKAEDWTPPVSDSLIATDSRS